MTEEISLLGAIVRRAADDLELPSERDDAIAWFQGRSGGDLSFECICEACGADRNTIINNLKISPKMKILLKQGPKKLK